METHKLHEELLRKTVEVLVVGCGGKGECHRWGIALSPPLDARAGTSFRTQEHTACAMPVPVVSWRRASL